MIERYERVTLRRLESLAKALAARLRPGDAVALSGSLGAGKTALVSAMVRALHGREHSSSPTFVFWQRYAGAPPVEHLDLYRIEDPAEARELGLHEALIASSVTFVEWPERLPSLLDGAQRLWRIAIEGTGNRPRTVVVEAPG